MARFDALIPWQDVQWSGLLRGEPAVIRRLGFVHTHGSWSYELTGSVFLYADNDEFLNGNTREQKPLYALQTHLVHVFRPAYVW